MRTPTLNLRCTESMKIEESECHTQSCIGCAQLPESDVKYKNKNISWKFISVHHPLWISQKTQYFFIDTNILKKATKKLSIWKSKIRWNFAKKPTCSSGIRNSQWRYEYLLRTRYDIQRVTHFSMLIVSNKLETNHWHFHQNQES